MVEIDKAKFGRRKYNRGRIMTRQRVFAGFKQKNNKNQFLIPTHNRECDILILIKTHIKPGSIIYSDCWKAYDSLSQESFEHLTVNHNLNFVDPVTGVHTQNMERLWRDIKANVPQYRRRE
ncbi:hypothetical protein K1T71_002846 [Dendrolimus kikuchii]|uniref:Uncharacterized protein n=1 Tax=Dendrolimus kikuchii TaxID=765133 RepID=A0ACC1DEE2_9NEOP|nr:hypothetical protein K1T71_002846 [Dendrolimus kikuchii]